MAQVGRSVPTQPDHEQGPGVKKRHAGPVAMVVGCTMAVIGLACLPAVSAEADNPPPSQVLSNYENSTGGDIVRDCGYSAPLPADPSSSLWLFCDTDTYGFNSADQWSLLGIVNGSTAAEGPSTAGEVPTGLSELTSPGSALPAFPNDDPPEQFLPTPAGLVTPAGLACDAANDSYAASWITGLTQAAVDSSDLLVSYNNYCVPVGGGSPLAEGFGLAQYNPATNALDSQVTVFSSTTTALPSAELLGAPVFSGRYLYLFGSYCADVYDATCISATGDAVYLARVPATATALGNPAAYNWYAGSSSWTTSQSSATSVISGATPLAVNVASFANVGQRLALIEETNLVGGFTVYEASSPASGWTEETSGTVPCTDEGDSFCRAIIGHPELSTSSDLLVSYFDPGAVPYYNSAEGTLGHVMVAAFPW